MISSCSPTLQRSLNWYKLETVLNRLDLSEWFGRSRWALQSNFYFTILFVKWLKKSVVHLSSYGTVVTSWAAKSDLWFCSPHRISHDNLGKKRGVLNECPKVLFLLNHYRLELSLAIGWSEINKINSPIFKLGFVHLEVIWCTIFKKSILRVSIVTISLLDLSPLDHKASSPDRGY